MASGRCSGGGSDWSYRAVLGCLGGEGDDDARDDACSAPEEPLANVVKRAIDDGVNADDAAVMETHELNLGDLFAGGMKDLFKDAAKAAASF